MANQTQRSGRNGYPLIALFILIGVVAIMVRMLTPLVTALRQRQMNLGDLAEASIMAFLATTLLGMIVGYFHFRQPRGIFIGIVCGVLLGPPIAAAAVIPVEYGGELLSVAVGGSVMMVLIGTALRLSSRRLIRLENLPSPSEPTVDSENASEPRPPRS